MRDAAPTVMLVTADLDVGGAQETVRSLATALPDTGCRVVVATFRAGPLVDEIRAAGTPVHVLPDRRRSVLALVPFLREARQRRRDLVRLLEAHDVEVVLTAALGTWELLVLTLARRVQVWWRIGNVAFTLRPEHLPAHRWLYRPKRAAQRWLRRLGARVVTGIVAVSEDTAHAVRDHLGGAAEDRIVVVVNGVDVDRFPPVVDRDGLRASLGIGPGDHLMAMVGTFKAQKGYDQLLEAVADVAGQAPDLHVALVGDGRLRGVIEARVRDLRLGDRVHLLGSRRDVPEILAASDSFVLPSLWEGMSVALLEAMATGLPVVATAVSGTTQVVRHGVEGWLVPPGDATALAAAITELLADPAAARARGASARCRIEAEFSSRRCAEQLVALFRQAGVEHSHFRGVGMARPSRWLRDRRVG